MDCLKLELQYYFLKECGLLKLLLYVKLFSWSINIFFKLYFCSLVGSGIFEVFGLVDDILFFKFVLFQLVLCERYLI